MAKLDKALTALDALITAGAEYPDASEKVCRTYGVKIEALRDAYDDLCVREDEARRQAPTTLRGEIAKFGQVRDRGCILRIEGESFIFEDAHDVANPNKRHRISILSSDERLEAHWAGYVNNVTGFDPHR